MYAVRDNTPIKQSFGTWSKQNGLMLQLSKNRWDRRTDLQGAEVVNAIFITSRQLMKLDLDINGNVVGSRGSIPDRSVFQFWLIRV